MKGRMENESEMKFIPFISIHTKCLYGYMKKERKRVKEER
jgi:hypothetical protein